MSAQIERLLKRRNFIFKNTPWIYLLLACCFLLLAISPELYNSPLLNIASSLFLIILFFESKQNLLDLEMIDRIYSIEERIGKLEKN
ncbi:hypothetical protein ACFL67_03160 [candidate division KSB1 bacterium]